MKRLIRWLLNHISRPALQRIAEQLLPLVGLFYAGRRVQCPVCGRRYRRFLPYGYVVPRPNALCPHCLALERHRLLWLYLTRETELLETRPRLLHVAPEVCLMRHLGKRYADCPDRYVTADLESPLARLHFDVRRIPLPDASFDCVICNHLLEHVADDRRALSEFFRVLRPGGRLILTTPNAPASLTRNPWHVREYRADELRNLLASCFGRIEMLGIAGNERVAAYYERNRESVRRLLRWDVLDLQHRLPRQLLQLPYDLLNRRNRRRLLHEAPDATASIRMEDYRLGPVTEGCFDLFFVAEKEAETSAQAFF